MNYEIVVAQGNRGDEFYGSASGVWSADGVGNTGNEFETIEEAEAGIESLKALGDEWAEAIFAIREIGERYPS